MKRDLTIRKLNHGLGVNTDPRGLQHFLLHPRCPSPSRISCFTIDIAAFAPRNDGRLLMQSRLVMRSCEEIVLTGWAKIIGAGCRSMIRGESVSYLELSLAARYMPLFRQAEFAAVTTVHEGRIQIHDQHPQTGNWFPITPYFLSTPVTPFYLSALRPRRTLGRLWTVNHSPSSQLSKRGQ